MTATTLNAISLFAGCGGSDLGLLSAGVDVTWANEISPDACSLYKQVTGLPVIEQGDVRDVEDFPSTDILAGCYPCQGYSQGGRRNHADKINYLYREFDRALRQIRPLAFIVENVNGMRFSQNNHLLQNQLVRFRLAGYSVSWSILNAADYGVPQDRRRLFIVGIRSDLGRRFEFPEPTHGQGGTKKKYVTIKDAIWSLRDAPDDSYNNEPFHWYYLSRNRRRTWSQRARCVVSHWRHVGLHPDSPPLHKVAPDQWEFRRNAKSARRYSYLECAALQGFPDPNKFDHPEVSVRQRFKAIGNAVPPPLFGAVARKLVLTIKVRDSQPNELSEIVPSFIYDPR